MIQRFAKNDIKYGSSEIHKLQIKSDVQYTLDAQTSITYTNDDLSEQWKIEVNQQNGLQFAYVQNSESTVKSLQDMMSGSVKLLNRNPTYVDGGDIFINGGNSIYSLPSQIYQKEVNPLAEYSYSGNTIVVSPGLNTIQTAISASVSGDIIYLQNGVYSISTIVSDAGKNLYFLGQSTNVQIQVQSTPLLQLFNLTGQYTLIKNIKFIQQVDDPNIAYTCVNYNNTNGVLIIYNCIFSSFKWSVQISCKNCQIEGSQFFYTNDTFATTLRCISINQLNSGKAIILNNTFKAGNFSSSSSGLNFVWISTASLLKGIISLTGNQDITTTTDRIRSLFFLEAFSNTANQLQIQIKDNIVKQEKNSIVLFYVTNINHLLYIKSLQLQGNTVENYQGKGLLAFDTSPLGGTQTLPQNIIDNFSYSNNTITNNTISNASYLTITGDGQASVRNNTTQVTIPTQPFIWYQNYLVTLQ